MEARRRTNIRDVARAAGVSVTTVSHALNGKGIVAAQTRQRVSDVARNLGYQPNAVARSLRSNSLGMLSLVMRPLDSLGSFLPDGVDYFLRFAGAASLQALDHGFGLMLTRDPTLPGAPRVALAGDAFIITDPVAHDPVIELLLREGIPFVTVGRDPSRQDYESWIDIDAPRLTTEALTHLVAQGATRVAIATGTDDNAWNRESTSTYLSWCRTRGQPPQVFSRPEASGEQGGSELASEMLSEHDRPDALYCLTGRHAYGAMQQFLARGVGVPEDILILAGSDCEQTRAATPDISAIELEPEVLASRAVEALAVRLGVAPPPRTMHRRIGHLIPRGSTRRAL
ncbi:LacI family DNA-binding transcriptional regulator [Microbacterium sp. SA39]|uniref:LacI family DNA-binding transcriptional regulator n=1 Tax=Microbacterium sp. SA39 TaxID=1263625 RepID=UPI0005FA3B8D|nr:LacI family DNA-binding transcriptional regulator [Microbacterium sp. SA39]KJQ54435.1 putative HTH-type transcriptional repressor ExuR [Microbacterium sp. SA39]